MKWKIAFLALCVALLAPGVSSAANLDFGAILKGGTIVDTGSNVSGTGILIDTLLVDGTTGHDGSYDVDGALPCGMTGSCAALSFDTATSSFSIVGSVPDLGVGSMTLVTGTISGWSFSNDFGIASFHATGTDTKAEALLSALGIAPATLFNFSGFTMGINPVACASGTCYTATSTDFINTSGVGENAVPEPGTLMLIGGGLIGLVRARRRVA